MDYELIAQELTSQMSLDEKISFCSVADQRFGKLERLDLPGILFCDNPYGNEEFGYLTDEERAVLPLGTALPSASAIAASWNKDLAYNVGRCMAGDSKENSVDMLLRPGVNIKRSPLCGRNFEYFSEDPVLSGELAGSFINGMQSIGVAACVKHFAVNNQELDRMVTNAVVSERALREIYLRSFQIAIQKGSPWTLMTSYNKINGQLSNSNRHLMSEILRGEWGYEGVVLSDAMAVHRNKVEAHLDGMDVELCVSPKHAKELRDAVEDDRFPMAALDEIVKRIIELELRIRERKVMDFVSDRNEGHRFARNAAADSAVLLTNDGLLPLDRNAETKIAVIGSLAKTPTFMGAGSGHMNGHIVDIPLDEIKRVLGTVSNLAYAPGYSLPTGAGDEAMLLLEAVNCAQSADVAIVFLGFPRTVEGEGFDRQNLDLPHKQIELLKALHNVNPRIVVALNTGAPVDLEPVVSKARAIVQFGYSGEAMGGAVADVLFGLAEPGGRLPETYPLRLEDTPAYLNFPAFPESAADVLYGEDIFVGYRWYEARDISVRFPFGHGLSYTSFEYTDISVNSDKINADDTLEVTITLKNSGHRAGTEVVQLYVKDMTSSFRRPEKELKAFEKVSAGPGDVRTVTFHLDRTVFEYYSTEVNKWVVEEGEFAISAGSSSRDIKQSITVYIASPEKPTVADEMTPIQRIVSHPGFKRAVKNLSPQAQGFFDSSLNPDFDLLMCLPLYRLTEKTFVDPVITKREMKEILRELDRQPFVSE